jgi:oligopeptidase A
MRRSADAKGLPGYLVTLHAPIYVPLMGHAEDRALREEVYRAFATRASEEGPDAGKFDNMPLVAETLRLRDEMAKLLGYSDYTALALVKRMARSASDVERFLDALIERAKGKGEAELAELSTFAKARLGVDELRPWDIGYVSQRLEEDRFHFSQEEIRPYLPEGKVITGMFSLVERIYGGHLERVPGANVWREGVNFYELYDAQGELRGGFYADLYARDGKNQGAWMDIVTMRSVEGAETILPVAYLNANFTEPAKGKETYLLHSEVETIFHEFGHVLHHIFGRTEVPELSMNDVEWDAVESPSQVMENWAWEREMLHALSSHEETGESLPDPLIDKLLSSRHYLSALALLRQLEFASVDMKLHIHPTEDPLATLDEVRRRVRVTPTIPEDRFLASFTHIFAGGYAAGYYSYLWAELIAADAFEAFQETGDAFDRSTGDLFLQSVLEMGSSRPFMRSYVEFRGREPEPDALLRSRGLLPSLFA